MSKFEPKTKPVCEANPVHETKPVCEIKPVREANPVNEIKLVRKTNSTCKAKSQPRMETLGSKTNEQYHAKHFKINTGH